MILYFIALGLLLFGGIIASVSKEKIKLPVCTIFSGISSMLLLFVSLFVILTGEVLIQNVNFSSTFGEINFVIDPLSAFFMIVISIMSFLGILYGNGYIKPYLNKEMATSSHCLFLMLLFLSMIMVVSVHNALFFLIVWEIMSLSSFFLVIFENKKKEVLSSGIKYMIYMHLSVIFIIAGFVLLAINSSSLNFADYKDFLSVNSSISNTVFFLLFIGFGIKAGFAPFHNWLPDAHPAAPSHVSGIMSGVMIKTGIYGILRTLWFIGIPSKLIAYTVLIISLLSALYGVLYAITQHNIKRLLAYHSIENIGIIGIGIGVGLLGLAFNNNIVAILGFSGGILHILNHSIFKELLFLSAGAVYLKTHTKDIEQLGGLIKKMPYTGVLFIIGSIAISGLPPFNGFISEFLIYIGMILGLNINNIASFITLIISLAGLALIGTMAILCFTKASGVMFLGNPRSENAEKVTSDVSKVMLIPMIVLALFTLLIGIFPQYMVDLILSPVSMFVSYEENTFAFGEIINILSSVSLLIFIFLGILAFVCLLRFLINRKIRKHSTWGCGYDKPNNRMQYTASSYADLFVSTLKPMFKRISHIKKPKEIFPKNAYYEVEIEDIEEAYIVKPLIEMDEKILSKFERIQNGNIQQYILFGLLFLILSIIGLIYFG